jgi:coproporphyrinogen III oxidase
LQLYPEFKAWCDRYFYLPARQEHRGVGGLFFDDLDAAEERYDVEAFVRDVAQNILPSWAPLVARHRRDPFTPAQRDWQLLRRGRYLEFNLLYDRGVKFGLAGGRMESIMVSAPPLVAWRYDVAAAPGSEEARLEAVLRQPRDWA